MGLNRPHPEITGCYLDLFNSAFLSSGFFVQTVRCPAVLYPHAKQAQSFCMPRYLTGSAQFAIESEQEFEAAANCPLPKRAKTSSFPSAIGGAASCPYARPLWSAIGSRSGVSVQAKASRANNPKHTTLAKALRIIVNSWSSLSTSSAFPGRCRRAAPPFLQPSSRRAPPSWLLPYL